MLILTGFAIFCDSVYYPFDKMFTAYDHFIKSETCQLFSR